MKLLSIILMVFLVLFINCQNLQAIDDPNSPYFIDMKELESEDFLEEVEELVLKAGKGGNVVSMLMDLDDNQAATA